MPRNSAIFDIGQGTGYMGKLLTDAGFNDIMGADASPSFVEKAEKTGWYKSTQVLWFGKGVDQLPDDLKNRFDLVMASGVFLEGHIPCDGFEDAHAMCKTGAYFITSIRKIYWDDDNEFGYKKKIDELVAAGKFSAPLKTWTFKRGIEDHEDPLFRPCEAFMFVVKRLD